MFKALKLTAKAKLSHGGISLSVGAVMVCLLTAAAGNYLSYLIGLFGSLIPGIEQTGFLLPVIQGIFCAAAMFFFSPLFLGCYRLFLLIARDEQPKLSEIFYYSGNGLYKCALKFSFSLLIRVLARLLISFLPLLVVVALFVFTPLKNTTSPIVGAAVFSIFIVLGAYPVCLYLYISFLCCHSIHNDAPDKQQFSFPPFKGNLSKPKRQYHPVLPEFYSLVFAGIFYNSHFVDYSLFLCNNDNFQLLP